MPAAPGVYNGGFPIRGLESKPSSGIEMLTVDANGNMGRQAIPSAPVLAWGNITGTLSAQTDLQAALNAKSSVGHVHAISDVTGLSDILVALDATKLNTSAFTFANIGGNAGDNTSLAAALAVKADSSALASYVAKAGDTMTGRLTTPSVLLSGNFSAPAWTTNGVGISHAARTLTDTSSSGTVAAAYTNVLGGNTIAASAATTYTDYASLFLGSPTAGTNVTITNSFSLITAGAARFGGKITAPATGQASTGGIGNGGNGIDFFQGVIVYNTSSATAPYPAYFCDGQSTSKLKLHPNTELQWDAGDPTSTRNNGDLRIARDAPNAWAQRNGANAQSWRLYGTYTDASNYRRLYLSSTTAGAFTLGVEGLGTGASGNTLNIANNLGIGTSSPNVRLVIRNSGADLPAIRLEDGDVTVPFTGISFSPSINANTVGMWQPVASSSGGCAFTGFTNNTAAAYPVLFEAYHGSASPTAPAVCFAGFKTNGSTGATTLASNELLAGFYNGSVVGSPVVSIAASGALTAEAATFTGALRVPTDNVGIYFSSSGNSHGRISPFGTSWYFDLNAAGSIFFRTNNSGTTNLTLYGGASPVGAFVNVGLAIGDQGTRIMYDANHMLAQRSGTNPQTFRIYNAFTDASNYDRGFVRWNSNVFEVGTERAGSYTTTRALNFLLNGSFAGGVQVSEYAGIGIRTSPAGNRAAFVGNSSGGLAYYSSAIGWEAGATANFGNAFGAFTRSDIDGRSVMCPGQGPVHADQQRTGLQTLSALTTDATTRPLAIPNLVGPGTHDAVPIATNHSCTIRGCIVAVRDTNTETASFVVDACVQNAGGTVTLVSNSVTQTSNNGNVWTVTVNANNVTKRWEILCTGEAGKNIRWSGVFLVAQVAY